MTDLREPSSNSGSDPSAGPYERLGLSPDASFDEVQAARQARLDEAGDDPIARSRVEAAYDAVLMDRLKERQQGRVSTAARSASA
ncbi:MAG: CPP1-like family protein, partial [Prochlorococcaceae cyanobacterium]